MTGNSEDIANEVESLKKEIAAKDEKINEITAELESLKTENRIILASIGHELKTPLTAIIGFTENLAEKLDICDSYKNNLHTVIKNGYHLSNLLNCILDFGKIGSSKLTANKVDFQLKELIEDISTIINFQTLNSNLNFSVNYHYPLPTHINSDPIRVRQVLINLCGNAIKYTNEGEITLDVSYSRQKHRLSFEVTDTGIGISESLLDKIFEPFKQASRFIGQTSGGSGLGLFLSYQIAKVLGGNLKVESELGKGSRFTFEIDPGHIEEEQFVWSEYEIRRDTDIENQLFIRELKGKVLFAEDNLDNQKLISLFISATGAKVDLAHNGKEALHKANSNNYDLILLDIHMPEINGIDAAKTIRTKNQDTPIVAITADNIENDKEILAVFDEVIHKPVDRKHLHEVLANALPRNRASAASNVLSKIEHTLETDPEYQQLQDSFSANLVYCSKKIEDALKGNNIDILKAEVHQLKGTAANFGKPEISKLAAEIDHLFKNNNSQKATGLCHKLGKLCKYNTSHNQ